MKSERTPTPWKTDGVGAVYTDEHGVICDCAFGETQIEGIANAEFIKLACNHHEELVSALIDLMDGHDAAHIQANTGLPWGRCVEIYQLYTACVATN